MSNLLAQIITTEDQVRELMKTVCDHGDYESCHLTEKIWDLLNQLKLRELTHLQLDNPH
ncbi:hypothetical protein [Anabaena sp. PCC 7108]|uniref:hypothetical protein n=1 Tax=Anabaena sp. PCC 7108 TaxID=163908 RepID=UPI00130D7014|nr:hypothetical protein [Anabaena sp. PCC 7108]